MGAKKTMRSASPMALSASSIINLLSNLSFSCIPGVSTKIICDSSCMTMIFIRFLVACAFLDTIASFSPTIWFKSVLLPALGRPTTATKPAFVSILSFSCSNINYSFLISNFTRYILLHLHLQPLCLSSLLLTLHL